MSVKKFGVGDVVMVKPVADMVAEFGAVSDGMPRVTFGFNSDMAAMFGKRVTIRAISGDIISLEDSRWNYHETMLMLVEKKKPEPAKKKITVAEIEKALGYGVEIIKG